MDHRHQEGSALIIVVLIVFLLTIAGIAAINETSIEIQIAGNDRRIKKDFYAAENGCIEKAFDVGTNSAAYAVTDIQTPTLLTMTNQIPPPLNITSGNHIPLDKASELSLLNHDNAVDVTWPAEHPATDAEYGYRVYYKNTASVPKGYDASQFGAYVFDITVRKQKSANNRVVEISNFINRGYIKMGPKNDGM